MYEESYWMLVDDDLHEEDDDFTTDIETFVSNVCVQRGHTLRMKSGGVPGLTEGLKTPSWWEWINVSSRSKTRIFLFTPPEVWVKFKHKTPE